MLLSILFCAATGLSLGLLLVNAWGLVLVSSVVSAVVLFVTPWDLLLIPKWFGLLTLLQLAWLAGAVRRVQWDERERKPSRVDGNLEDQRVLIVEGDPATAACLADEVHAASGEPVGPAGSVCAALQIIENEKLDGAVLDYRLTTAT